MSAWLTTVVKDEGDRKGEIQNHFLIIFNIKFDLEIEGEHFPTGTVAQIQLDLSPISNGMNFSRIGFSQVVKLAKVLFTLFVVDDEVRFVLRFG